MAKTIGKCIAAALAAFLLAGCAAQPAETAPTTVAAESTPAPAATAEPTPTPTPAPTPAPDEEEAYAAYLRDVLLPSMGTVSPGTYPAEQVTDYGASLALDGVSSAAVLDVDGDGGKELVLAYFVSRDDEESQGMVTNLRFSAYRMENGAPVQYIDTDPFVPQDDPDAYNTPYLSPIGVFSGQEVFLQEQGGKTYLAAIDRYAVDDADTFYRFYTFAPDGLQLDAEYYFGGHEGLFLTKNGETLAGYSYMGEPLPEGAAQMESEAEVEVLLEKELGKYGAQSSRSNLMIFQQGAPQDDNPPGRTNLTLVQGWGGDEPPYSYGAINFELYDFTGMQARTAA